MALRRRKEKSRGSLSSGFNPWLTILNSLDASAMMGEVLFLIIDSTRHQFDNPIGRLVHIDTIQHVLDTMKKGEHETVQLVVADGNIEIHKNAQGQHVENLQVPLMVSLQSRIYSNSHCRKYLPRKLC